MDWRKSSSKFKWRLILVLTGLIFFLAMLSMLPILNSDLYGRLTETKLAAGVNKSAPNLGELPTVRLILHKLPTDENAVEASMVFIVEDKLREAITNGQAKVSVTLTDGSSVEPYGLLRRMEIDASTLKANAGMTQTAVQSERFSIPSYPTVDGYPFDDVMIRPIIWVQVNAPFDFRFNNYYKLEIEKALPGRIMELNDENIVTVTLTRSVTEKALVITSSIIFIILTVFLSFGLFTSKEGLSTVEEIVAVGGYLIAAAGFRDLLGVTRVAGTSALEITIIGFPLVLVTIGVSVSFFRGLAKNRGSKRRKRIQKSHLALHKRKRFLSS